MLDVDLVDSLQAFERYLNVPVVSVERTMILARDLLAVDDRLECPSLDEACAELERELRTTELLFARHAATHDYTAEQREVAIEDLTDRLWTSLLKILHGWKAFLHPQLRKLDTKQEQRAKLDEARAKAERAMVLYRSVFPVEEFGFVIHPPFHEQAQTLEAFVRLSEDPAWADAKQLAGEHMIPLMHLVQRQHQSLISSGRWSRREGSPVGLQRAKLRRRIGRYNNVVVALIEADDEPKLHTIQAMLAPVDELIEQLRASDELVDAPEPGLS